MIVAGVLISAPVVAQFGPKIARLIRADAARDGFALPPDLLDVVADLEMVARRAERTAVTTADARQPDCRSVTLEVDVKTAATRIGTNERNVRDLIARGRLSARRAPKGRAWLIDEASVVAYIEDRDDRRTA